MSKRRPSKKSRPRKGPQRWGYCPKCHRKKEMTIHHVLPRRHFGAATKGYDPMVIPLCRECHRALEKGIPFSPKKERDFYFQVVINFLGLEEERVRFSRELSPEQYLTLMSRPINDYSYDPDSTIILWPELSSWNPRQPSQQRIAV